MPRGRTYLLVSIAYVGERRRAGRREGQREASVVAEPSEREARGGVRE
jgi:hypothetical protein